MDALSLLQTPEFSPIYDCRGRIEAWLKDTGIDTSSKSEVESLILGKNVAELRDRFYRELEFGTGGLRGVIGAGNNRMNVYVVRRCTQGLANYICKQGEGAKQRGVAIAYDCRHFSDVFAQESASVLAANGIRVFLYPTLSTTPSLSFAIRRLGCISGICVTASHNPPQYNGFKVYWEDGAQIVPPTDAGILGEVFAVKSFSEVKHMTFEQGRKNSLIRFIGDDVLEAYFSEIDALKIYSECSKNVAMVYTPLHGTGAAHARRALDRWGFTNCTFVPEQEKPDGNFPTVKKPNPEEPEALKMAVALAEQKQAAIVVATDPDSDRFALVVRDPKAAQGWLAKQAMTPNYVFLNGNQTGALIIDHILRGLKEKGRLKPNHKIVKTIVTSELHRHICSGFGIEVFDCLTGFKWIASLVRNWEESGSSNEYLFGTEESFGYMPGPYVRDKDGISAICIAAEMTSHLQEQGKTACDRLLEIFAEHGAWQEDLINIDLVGEAGAARIGRMMQNMREKPHIQFAGIPVAKIFDYKSGTISVQKNGSYSALAEKITIPSSDVLQFELEEGSRISMRPSGTEPKIKFYISVCTKENEVKADYIKTLAKLAQLNQSMRSFVDSVQ